MKKSVVLLIVLGFIVILISISGYIFNIYNKYMNEQTTYIAQDSLVIKDIKSILDNHLKDINGSDITNIFTSYPPISNKDFTLNITIKPIFNRININNYLLHKKIDKNIDDVFTNLLNFYQVDDVTLFKDLILDTIDIDEEERDNESEISLINPLFQNGQIYNKKHFEQILDYYVSKSGDKTVYNIPWDKYIFFGQKGKINMIDCNLMDANLAQFIGLQTNYDIITCKNLETPENKKLLRIFNIKKFSHRDTYWIKVNIKYNKNSLKNNLTMVYDIKSKKVIKIEKNPIY